MERQAGLDASLMFMCPVALPLQAKGPLAAFLSLSSVMAGSGALVGLCPSTLLGSGVGDGRCGACQLMCPSACRGKVAVCTHCQGTGTSWHHHNGT